MYDLVVTLPGGICKVKWLGCWTETQTAEESRSSILCILHLLHTVYVIYSILYISVCVHVLLLADIRPTFPVSYLSMFFFHQQSTSGDIKYRISAILAIRVSG